MKILFNSEHNLSDEAKKILLAAKSKAFGPGPVTVSRAEPGPNVVCFGTDGGIKTLSTRQLFRFPNAAGYVAVAFREAVFGPENRVNPWPDRDPEKILYFDIESHNAGKQWNMAPEDFFRLGQYAWGPTGDVVLTTDYHEMIAAIRAAEGVVGHNIHAFDLSVLFGTESIEPLEMAMARKVFDTFTHAVLAAPAPETYVNRKGQTLYGDASPSNTLKWLGLDNLCFQLNLPGKEGDLQALAKKYNPAGTLVRDLDYSLIPTDDPDFRAYSVQDVISVQGLCHALVVMSPPTEYDWREQLNAAIDAQNSRNGIKVDIPAAQARADMLAERKDVLLKQLEADYGFPTTGKSPWASTAGKAAIMKALADQGITPATVPNWTKTSTGNLSLGGQVLIDITKDTPAEDFGQSLAELKGQRSLSRLALDSVQSDGKAHPEITAVQRSGRKSTTKPGLTVWSSKGSKGIEKAYFVPDSEDELLVELDFSNADQRIIAALSGDVAYLERFEEGVDGHEINGRIMFGDEVYDSNPAYYRDKSKAPGHAYTYGAGPKKLASTTGLPLNVLYQFVDGMKATYPDVTNWQNRVRRDGDSGFVTNSWGRKMVVADERSYTQSPALHGQSGTREIVVDALIRMLYLDTRLIQWLKIQVHDALVFSIPKEHLDWALPMIKGAMECFWQPKDGSGQLVEFPVSCGTPSKNWQLAGH